MYRAITLVAALGIASVSAAGELCLDKNDQYKICLTGTPIQKSLPQAINSCKFYMNWNNMNKKCNKLAVQQKAFNAALNAANCMANKLGLLNDDGSVDSVQLAFITGNLPNTMLAMFNEGKVNNCATKLKNTYNNSIKKCKYKKKDEGKFKGWYQRLAPVKCMLDHMQANCSSQAKLLLKALMNGLLSITE